MHQNNQIQHLLYFELSAHEVRLVKKTVEDKDNDIKMLKEQINSNNQHCTSDRQSAIGEITRTE